MLKLEKINFILFSCYFLLISGCSDKGNINQYKDMLFGNTVQPPVINKTGPNIVYSKYIIYSDNNGDGVVNKGETVKIKIYLKNTGNSNANTIFATMTDDSNYVTMTTYGGATKAKYYNIAAGYESNSGNAWNEGGYEESYQYSYEFVVSQNVPANHSVKFTLNITDVGGNIWNSSFSIVVQQIGANIVYSKYIIYSDNNGDGVVNKGETVKIKIYLKNTGNSNTNTVFATMTDDSSYVTMTTYGGATKAKYYNIAAGYESNSGNAWNEGGYEESYQYSYEFMVNQYTLLNHIINFTLNITDAEGNTWTSNFSITVQQIGANIIYSKHIIYSDNNGDGIVNKGETVKIKVYLKNTGNSNANTIFATMTDDSNYVTMTTYGGATKAKYYNIAARYESNSGNAWNEGGYEESYQYSYEFTASQDTPANHSVKFALNIADEFTNNWISSFIIYIN